MKKRNKKLLTVLLAGELLGSLILAAVPASAAVLTGTPYTANEVYDVTVPHIIINQVYGGGSGTDTSTYVSNGFIELYNPTNNDVELSDWSLQYADNNGSKTGPTGVWKKLDLTGIIKAHSSYLVKGNATGASNANKKVDLAASGDILFDQMINNKGLKVALMSNQILLTDINPFNTKAAGYVDMLGTASNDPITINPTPIDAYEFDFPVDTTGGTSKKIAVRRKSFIDTDNNKSNFEQVSYADGLPAFIALVKPRSGADGAWFSVPTITNLKLLGANIAAAYSYQLTLNGGHAPFTFTASDLPSGLAIDSSSGLITGIPAAGTKGTFNVTVSVTDSANSPAMDTKILPITIEDAIIADTLSITKLAQYSVGTSNEDGGVAEIVKYNKENGKFYLVNGATEPPTLEIVSMTKDEQTQGVLFNKVKAIDVQKLSETDGFLYGDLTSVDVNTITDRVAVSVQEKDSTKNGKILVLDYDGNLLKAYEAGVQPDMIKSTEDGRYILTADEGEPRTAIDPEGSITIVDTTTDSVTHVKFDTPSVIADNVHIRGASDPITGLIKGSGTKADARFDFEPEYITLSSDNTKAYVSLQENNAVATIDIAAKSVISVIGLGFKDYNLSSNSLDLVKDSQIKLENVPFKGMYMPDGIASYKVDGKTYLFTGNEGDVTDWSVRKNGSTIGSMKAGLALESPAEVFLRDKGNTYDGVEVASDMGNDGIYMYGGRSFSVWDAESMEQVFDSGNDFEKVTSQRVPANFNTSNSKIVMDDRSGKKGPEPEDIKVGKVGNKLFAFVGLERVGGLMTYDVTDPKHPTFANYLNSRLFVNKVEADNAPEGIDFIPATMSPTGLPLILVANEVGGTVSVLQMNITKVVLDESLLSMTLGDSPKVLNATVTPVGGGAATVAWSSSNPAIASVDVNGQITALASGAVVVTAISADGYGTAEAKVTISVADAAGLTLTSSDVTGVNTNGKTKIKVSPAAATGNRFVYKNLGVSSVAVPHVYEVWTDYSELNTEGIITAANGDKIAVAEIDGRGQVVKFGQTMAIVADEAVTQPNPTPKPSTSSSPAPTATPSPTPAVSSSPTPAPAATALPVQLKPDADNTKATVTTEVKAVTDNNGKATAAVSNTQIEDALKALTSNDAAQKEKIVEIKVAVESGAKQAVIGISTAAFAKIAQSGTDTVSIDAGIGQISFDKKSIASISGTASNGDIAVSITKKSAADVIGNLPEAARDEVSAAILNRPIFDFSVTVEGKKLTDFAGGTVNLIVPYTPALNEDLNAIIIYYIADNGDIILVPNGVYDPATGSISFGVKHFSQYAVGYKKAGFNDTTQSFAKDEITFLAARNIINGMETTKYAPQANVTRADFVLILARAAEADLANYNSSKFTDVHANDYYAQAVEWATANGITSGVANGRFDPKANITREQMATMIVRLTKVLALTLPTTIESIEFADQGLIPAYALESAKVLQQANIIHGKPNANQASLLFAPKDTATREEAAKMLAMLLQISTK